MNLITFTYTKNASEVSNRVAVPLNVPNDKYFCIDVSDLDIEDQALISAEITAAELEKQSKIVEIMTKYDVRTNFRSFLPSKMSNMIEE